MAQAVVRSSSIAEGSITVSYVLQPFLVDITKLRAAIGSRDASLVAAIIENDPDAFDLDDQDDDELPLAEALEALIMEEPLESEDAHQYGYAFKEICDYLGEALEPDLWNGVRWTAVEGSGLEDLLNKTGAPVNLPANAEFPYIGHIRRADLGTYLQGARDRRQSMADSEIKELLDELIDWLEIASHRGLDLVVVYH